MQKLDKQILNALKNGVETTQRELAATFCVKPTGIAQALTRLQKAGLVDLKRCKQRTLPQLKVLRLLDELLAAQHTLKDAIA